MQLNEKQQVAVDAIMSGENVFLTGGGGRGKTFVIRYLESKGLDLVICAPTGQAALNAGGITAHSLFGLPIGLPSMDDWTKVGKKARNLFSGNNPPILVLDELGMSSALTLDLIDAKLQLATNSNKPFGGVQVVGSGDFLQLEPIIGQREKKYYYEQYNTPFAFGAKCWDFKTILFDVSERHPNKKHVRMLDSIRMKDYRHIKALELIQKGAKKYDLREEKLTLCCYNQDAENINSYHYNKIKESEVHYYGEFIGVPFKDNELLVDRDITLKVGAKVLIKANDPEGCYVNGDRGVVLSCGADSVTVSLDRGGVVSIKPFTWDKFDFNKGIKGFSKVVVASFTQLPIKLGYAVSMHAAQGITLDDVAIDIGKGCFSAGQAYMALSRIKNLDNISFVREVKPSDVIVHESAVNFYKNLSNVEGLV